MEIIIWVLLAALLLVIIYIFLFKREIRNIIKQLGIIADCKTNAVINADFIDTDLIDLINMINRYIKKCTDVENRDKISKDSLRNTILNMSHDVRTPLTSVQGYLHLLEMEEISNRKKKMYLKVIKDRTELLHNMMENFFELAKIESDNFTLNLKCMDLFSILSEALALYYDEFQKVEIEMKVDFQETLYVLLDENAMKRVLHNILNNIVKHGARMVQITSFKKGKKAIMTFTNDAQDINQDNVKLLFDKFFTISHSRSKKNTGLGLAITKELVERMNGNIEAKYSEGNFTLIISFPLCEFL
ncbi:sensor histidine kinase [Thomasclavelia sp.]